MVTTKQQITLCMEAQDINKKIVFLFYGHFHSDYTSLPYICHIDTSFQIE
jgi:hypothetical protein